MTIPKYTRGLIHLIVKNARLLLLRGSGLGQRRYGQSSRKRLSRRMGISAERLEARVVLDGTAEPLDALFHFESTGSEIAHGAVKTRRGADIDGELLPPFMSPTGENGDPPERYLTHPFSNFALIFSELGGSGTLDNLSITGYEQDFNTDTVLTWFLPVFRFTQTPDAGPVEFSHTMTLTENWELPGLTIPVGTEIRSDYAGLVMDYDDPASYWFDPLPSDHPDAPGLENKIYRGGTHRVFWNPPGGGTEILFESTNVELHMKFTTTTGEGTWSGRSSGNGRFDVPISGYANTDDSTLQITAGLESELFRDRTGATTGNETIGLMADGAFLTKSLSFGYDYGDAPRGYPEAWHTPSGVQLGQFRDGDFPFVTPTVRFIDDGDQLDDEDGVTFGTLEVGQAGSLTVDVSNLHPASSGAYISAWLDFDRDLNWNPSDQILVNEQVTADGVYTFDDWHIPGFVVPGGGYNLRVRISESPISSASGHIGDGEVEDYEVILAAPGFDYGDAPASYDQQGAAAHIAQGVLLGTQRDKETTPAHSADATGDGADEDGVRFGSTDAPGLLRENSTNELSITVSEVGPGGAYISAWVDSNQDGEFGSGPDEQIVDRFYVNQAGVYTTSDFGEFQLPPQHRSGPEDVTTFARVRIASAATYVENPYGTAPNGEVEDYQVTIGPELFDFGDAPEIYDQFGAASHRLDGPQLGPTRDGEEQPQSSTLADGDGADEDGATFQTLRRNTDSRLEFSVEGLDEQSGEVAYVSAWVDYRYNPNDPQSRSFDSDEQILVNFVVAQNRSYSPLIELPPDAVEGFTYARVRISDSPINDPNEPLPSGEVEDYRVEILPELRDFGDVPAPYDQYQFGPASHGLDFLRFGTRLDGELGPQSSEDADGDGIDEDGITFGDLRVSSRGTITFDTFGIDEQIGQRAYVSAWIDFDRQFQDPNSASFDHADQVLTDEPIRENRSYTRSFEIPSFAQPGSTYARVRISTVPGLEANGGAPDGEVQDYRVEILPELFDFGDAPAEYDQFGPAQHRLHGPRFGTRDGESGPQSSEDATGDGDDDNEVTVTELRQGEASQLRFFVEGLDENAGQTAYVSAWIDFNSDPQNPVTRSFDSDDQIVQNFEVIQNGFHEINFNVPGYARLGETYLRTRIALNPVNEPGFGTGSGEVEDRLVTILEPSPAMDYGDAPESYFTSTTSHTPGGPILGSIIDYEDGPNASTLLLDEFGQPVLNPQGAPLNLADGDDSDVQGDDEDGVVFNTELFANQVAASLTAFVTNAPAGAYLSSWIDFDRNGRFSSNEQITDALFVTDDPNGNEILFNPADYFTVEGPTYARFRLHPNAGSIGAAAEVTGGEIEDYLISFGPDRFDYGDASESYGIAEHEIIGPQFGTSRDSELASQFSADANGDDIQGSDDEDGLISHELRVGESGTVTLDVQGNDEGEAYLSAWIDWDEDGAFSSNEAIVTQAFVGQNGLTTLTIDVDDDASVGPKVARFRIASDSDQVRHPIGSARSGEVEDHILTVLPERFDHGDAPASYGDAFHRDEGVRLGDTRDREAGPIYAAPGELPLGDDTSGIDDEDGVTFSPTIHIGNGGGSMTVEVRGLNSGQVAFVSAWIDLDQEGDFENTDGERVLVNRRVESNGFHAFEFNVPSTAVVGESYARVRVARTGLTEATGSGTNDNEIHDGAVVDGEVEDYRVEILPELFDYGDAPASYISSDPARHRPIGVRLGSTRDAEIAPQASVDATGDDITPAGTDDEDGVTFSTLTAGETGSLTVNVQGIQSFAYINAWIDFNGDGAWDRFQEDVIFRERVTSNGNHTFSFDVPEDAAGGETFARVKVSRLGPTFVDGFQPDGEVEDYAVNIIVPPEPRLSQPPNRSINEDSFTFVNPLTVSDPNFSADQLVVTATSSNQTLVRDDEIYTFPFNTADGPDYTRRAVRIRPEANQFGQTTITYTVTNPDGLQTSKSFVLTVNSVNDRPVVNDDSYIGKMNQPLVVNAADGLIESSGTFPDFDVDGPTPLTIEMVDPPTNGFVAIQDDGSFTYAPIPNFIGTDSFTYNLVDGDGLASLTPATVTIEVAPVETDLQLTVDSPEVLDLGDLDAFEVTTQLLYISNAGSETATAATLNFELPGQLLNNSGVLDILGNPLTQTRDGDHYTVELGDIAAGDGMVLQLPLIRSHIVGNFEFTVTASHLGSDPISDNNSVTFTSNQVSDFFLNSELFYEIDPQTGEPRVRMNLYSQLLDNPDPSASFDDLYDDPQLFNDNVYVLTELPRELEIDYVEVSGHTGPGGLSMEDLEVVADGRIKIPVALLPPAGQQQFTELRSTTVLFKPLMPGEFTINLEADLPASNPFIEHDPSNNVSSVDGRVDDLSLEVIAPDRYLTPGNEFEVSMFDYDDQGNLIPGYISWFSAERIGLDRDLVIQVPTGLELTSFKEPRHDIFNNNEVIHSDQSTRIELDFVTEEIQQYRINLKGLSWQLESVDDLDEFIRFPFELGFIASEPGDYTIDFNLVPLESSELNSNDNQMSLDITVNPPDLVEPWSTIEALPAEASSKQITLNWSSGDEGHTVVSNPHPSGVDFVRIEYATGESPNWDDPGWTTIGEFAPDVTTTTFDLESNTTYWFRSSAYDRAGNLEYWWWWNEATISVGDLDAPATWPVSVTEAGNGLRLSVDGEDYGGGEIDRFEFYVEIDGGPATLVASEEAEPWSIWYSGSTNFVGPADGVERTYRFWAIAIDDSGNREADPTPSEIVEVNHTFEPQPLAAIDFEVNQGQVQRSFIHTLDVTFNTSDTAVLQALIDDGRFQLEQFAIDSAADAVGIGTGALIDLTGVTYEIIGTSTIRLSLGNLLYNPQDGFGGLSSNGFYRLSVDENSDDLFGGDDAHLEFFRLQGDRNGDGQITLNNANDLFVRSVETEADLNNDLNGDGVVDQNDLRVLQDWQLLSFYRDQYGLTQFDHLLAVLNPGLQSLLDD